MRKVSTPVLNIYAGKEALTHLRKNGLNPEDIKIILGASSGPKWLVLHGLDKYFLSHFFSSQSDPINTLGTSAGAWRMASYSHPDNIESHRALTKAYVNQRYSKKPSPEEVLQGCRQVLSEMIGDQAVSSLLEHDLFHLNMIVTQCHGLSGMRNKQLNMLGFGVAALANKISRRSLSAQFTRVMMRHPVGGLLGQPLHDLPTRYADLSPSNLRNALLATGSIPIIIEGIRDLVGKGLYQDGGITDYAFDLPLLPKDGFVLFPHFAKFPIPGWFDKAWVSKRRPWRRPNAKHYSKTILITPSEEFVAKLPFGKIPDRHDFLKMDDYTRIKFWNQVVDRSQHLADDFDSLDWQARVQPLPW